MLLFGGAASVDQLNGPFMCNEAPSARLSTPFVTRKDGASSHCRQRHCGACSLLKLISIARFASLIFQGAPG